jgi:hypothetical protein
MEKVGPSLVGVGSAFGTSGSFRDDGAESDTSGLIGYRIVEADDLAHAKALTDGLPFLAGCDGAPAENGASRLLDMPNTFGI